MKKLTILIVSALLLSLIVLPSCRKVSGSGSIVTEQRSVADFTEIRNEMSGDVYVSEGSGFSVQVEAQQNIIDVIETVISANTLTLRLKSNTILKSNTSIKIHITMPKLNGLQVSGSGNVEALTDFNTDDLNLRVSGSGNVSLNKIFATNVTAKISGSGAVSGAGGTVDSEVLDISGSGSIDLTNLEAKTGDIKISGSGNARVFVTESLKIRISGSGNVYYKGTPTIDLNTSGSGNVQPI